MRLDIHVEYLGRELSAGVLDTDDGEGFAYSRDWLEQGPGCPISLSLPLQEPCFGHRRVRPYFDGLLPEGGPRNKIASELHVSPRSYAKILAGIGWECIGAVSVHGSGPRPDEGYLPLSEGDLAAIAVRLRDTGGTGDGRSRFSLAGAQPKTALYRSAGGGWFQPVGGAPSTHVVKPASERFADAAVNEAVCTLAAARCGVFVPKVEVVPGEPALLVAERFDRCSIEGARVLDGQPVPVRLHQEDLCQALGFVPEHKYEEQSGRGYLERVAELLRRHSTSTIADLERLWDYAAFAFVIGNCDMHLKNIAILRSADWRRLSLAPAYDMVATAQYGGLSVDMAMGIGGIRSIDRVDSCAFEREARALMLPVSWATERAAAIAAAAPDAVAQAAAELEASGIEGAAAFAQTVLPGMRERISRLLAG